MQVLKQNNKQNKRKRISLRFYKEENENVGKTIAVAGRGGL
jgi:hypothetical protein